MISQGDYGRVPTVFVSSTCYDLKQVRTDIRDFINNQLGYEAILSEFDSFPLEPELSAVENCIRVVKERADIFCLIIGGRYGSITDSGKSITNLEYINARAKGIPIYVFVNKEILTILQVWERNPMSDYGNIVDNSQLFEFVSELRGKENIWIFGFENAQDIIKAFRKQLSYLFYDSLRIRERIHINKLSPRLQKQTGKVLKIIVEKPDCWEHLLLGEILEQSFYQHNELRLDLTYGISYGKMQRISEVEDIFEFITLKIGGIQQIISNLNILFRDAIPEAVGAPGEPGDEEKIIYVGERIGQIYESILKWGMEFKTLSVDDDWRGLVNAVSKIWGSPIADLDDYIEKYKAVMSEVRLHLDKYLISEGDVSPTTVDLSLTLKEPDLSDFYTELEKIRETTGISYL